MLSNELSKPGASKSTPAAKRTAALKRKSAQLARKGSAKGKTGVETRCAKQLARDRRVCTWIL